MSLSKIHPEKKKTNKQTYKQTTNNKQWIRNNSVCYVLKQWKLFASFPLNKQEYLVLEKKLGMFKKRFHHLENKWLLRIEGPKQVTVTWVLKWNHQTLPTLENLSLINNYYQTLYKYQSILTVTFIQNLHNLLSFLSTNLIHYSIFFIYSLQMAKNVAESPLERNNLASLDNKLAMAKRCSHGIFALLLL